MPIAAYGTGLIWIETCPGHWSLRSVGYPTHYPGVGLMAKRNDNNSSASTKSANRLLAALPAAELSRLEPHLKQVDLPFKQVLLDPGQRIVDLYFPLSGIVSTVKEFDNGDIIEVATIGNEGMYGNSVVLDVPIEASKVLVQVAGTALRMQADLLLKLLEDCPTLRRTLLRYSQALFHQVAQNAACNRAHEVNERCARWLLMSQDRVGGDRFTLTQEFMAQMLGVHRPTVSVAAGILQKAGIITFTRGNITVLDRAALEAASCECYALIVQHYQRALRSKA